MTAISKLYTCWYRVVCHALCCESVSEGIEHSHIVCASSSILMFKNEFSKLSLSSKIKQR